jgi:hypothetical protein
MTCFILEARIGLPHRYRLGINFHPLGRLEDHD